MKVLIGVDPHKVSLAVAAIDEATGELLERASFPQDHTGLRRLGHWARRFTERAARILRSIRPKGASDRLRRRLASEILRDVRTLEGRWSGRSPT